MAAGRADLRAGHPPRAPSHPCPHVHIHQRRSHQNASHDVPLFRHPPAPRTRTAVQGQTRKHGRNGIGVRSVRRLRDQPGQSCLRVGRIRTSRSERTIDESFRRDRKHARPLDPGRCHGLRHIIAHH